MAEVVKFYDVEVLDAGIWFDYHVELLGQAEAGDL